MITLNDITGFEWDEGNAGKNFRKHGITDKESEEAFKSNVFIVLKTSYLDEERFQLFGESMKRKTTVIFTIRKNKIRIISAREMSRKERNYYEEKLKQEAKADPGIQK